MIVFGIDPGITGAVAALEDGEYVGVRDLPLSGVIGSAVRWADPTMLTSMMREMLYALRPTAKQKIAYVERIHFSRQGGHLAAPTIMGSVFATLEMWGCPFVIVEAMQWKRHAGLVAAGSTGVQRKAASLAKARTLFPTCDELERKKDHNRAEALLIASYGLAQHRKPMEV